MIRICVFLFSVIFISHSGFSQTDKTKAKDKGAESIKLMDQGKIDESIKLLKEAEKLDPESIDYPYEIALAHYFDKQYKKSIKLLEELKTRKNANDRVHQLLGNSYSMNGQREKAIAAYETGLNIFPASGILYLERGNMEMFAEKYLKALDFYEKGIKADPKFPSNYYWATRIYCSSTEEVWGMIYGEIFMNLERNSKRTEEISKLLFETYKSGITITSDTSYTVSFSKNATIDISDLNGNSLKLPFGIGVYEPTLMLALINEKNIDLTSLNRIRATFTDLYFQNKNHEKYPNILFSYQDKVKSAGQLEAYNYWILMKGDEEEFGKWQENNKEKWSSFIGWFTDNPLVVNDYNKFYSGQY